MFVCLIVSSPYLLVFGDYRVRSTREQIMLQVDLMSYRTGTRLVWEKSFIRVFIYFGIILLSLVIRI